MRRAAVHQNSLKRIATFDGKSSARAIKAVIPVEMRFFDSMKADPEASGFRE